ncbi:hypothetical protein [Clostridium thermarum]|uniref:hypothetical protein n=1 Tax=Clostridium thermarum TaxID=1716543 RepID=UPI00111EA809|nr:hypothetical protein [Clostridium thermarum]
MSKEEFESVFKEVWILFDNIYGNIAEFPEAFGMPLYKIKVLIVLKLMADKAYNTNRIGDFIACHYKLFQDDMNVVNYGHGVDIVADKMHTQQEKEFIYALDALLCEMGYYAGSRESNEGPGYAYYSKESDVKKRDPIII